MKRLSFTILQTSELFIEVDKVCNFKDLADFTFKFKKAQLSQVA